MVVTSTANAAALLQPTTSVTAFDAQDLVDKGIDNIGKLSQFTPNLEIKTAGSTTPALFIRGVGLNSFDANAAGAVAVYRDDVSLNLPGFQAGQLFDLDGIVVLKGPQGSGRGRNASAGAIRISSKKPTGDFNASLRTDYGNFGYYEVEGTVGGPIIPDVLAARAAFKLRHRDGIFKNRCGGLPPFNADDPDDPINLNRVINPQIRAQSLCGETIEDPFNINNPDRQPGEPSSYRLSRIPAGLESELNDLGDWGARFQLRYQPELLDQDWILSVHGSEIDQVGTVGQPLGTAGGFLGSVTAAPQSYQEPEIRAELERLLTAELTAGGFVDTSGNPIPVRRCDRDPACSLAAARARNQLANNLASDRPLDLDPFTGSYNLPGYERQTTWGAALNGTAEIGNLQITSVTAFDRYDRERLIDFDFTPTTIFEFESEDDAWQLWQEIRGVYELEDIPLEVRAGSYMIVEELDYRQRTIAGGDVRPLEQVYTQTLYGVSAYGELKWDFTDDFELIAGARFNWEKKEFEVLDIRTQPQVNRCTQLSTVPGAILPDCDEVATFSDPTGTAALIYHLNDDVTARMMFTRGWKGAQFNISNGTTRDTYTIAKPERIDSVEFGFDGAWLDGRLRIGAAMFFYRYDNYQVFLFTNDFSSPPQRIVENANDARLYGADGEVEFEPIDQLTLTLGWSWIESAFLDFKDSGIRRIVIDPDEPPRITEVPIDFTGNRLPNTPRFKISGSIKYVFEFFGGTLTPVYNVVYTDDVFFDPSNGRGAPNNQNNIFLPDYTIGQKGFMLHDLRLTWTDPTAALSTSFWIRNMTNEVYKQVGFDASATAGLVGNFLGDPRTFGLSVKLTY
jgi:outer membrane receptor protein involved in Fe transport